MNTKTIHLHSLVVSLLDDFTDLKEDYNTNQTQGNIFLDKNYTKMLWGYYNDKIRILCIKSYDNYGFRFYRHSMDVWC